MKKILGWILLMVIAAGSIFTVWEKSRIYNYIAVKNDNLEIKIRYKGLKRAVDFTMDDKNIYVLFPDRVLCIPLSGEPYNLFEEEGMDFSAAEINGDKLYVVGNHKLMTIDTVTGIMDTCIEDIPNYGDYQDVVMKFYGDSLLISIGSATNSGIVGDDNIWTDSYEGFHDIPSFDIKLKANPYGAFTEKGTGNTENQVVHGEKIGTSSIVEYNTNTKEISTYAWGIRNVKGMAVSSDGRIFVTSGGYENRGIRPVNGDCDYIFEIKKGCWYGFPDYSGGDPLDSPRFSETGIAPVEMLMSEIPMNAPAPLYQHDALNALSFIVMDNGGIINSQENNYIYFYDSRNRRILSSGIGGSPRELIQLQGNADVKMMKIINEGLYILDSNNGFLYTIGLKKHDQ